MRAGRPRWKTLAAGAAVAGVVLAGCGGADDGEALPAPGDTTFGDSPLDDLPLPPEAEPVGPLSEQEGTTTRSYAVPDLAPTDVMEFYERALADDGWTVEDSAEFPTGLRADWTRADERLRVSVNEATGLDEQGDEPDLTQISLVLSPR